MQAITLTVTNDKEKIFSHSTGQLATEDVFDFRNCVISPPHAQVTNQFKNKFC